MKTFSILALITASALFSGIAYCQEYALTVYNDDLAVVKVIDNIKLVKGIQTVAFDNVPERIDPTSVRLKGSDSGFKILEQDYRFDLVNSQKLLSKYIGKKIILKLKEEKIAEGILQSGTSFGDIVLKNDNGISVIRLDSIEKFEFPELPEGLITKPSLFWKIDSPKDSDYKSEISYMTGGFEWHAEYNAVISNDEKEMEVSSWVSVNNNSGMTFKDATLKLVAGDVQKVKPPVAFGMALRKNTMEAVATDQSFEERGLFEYHIYELNTKTTLSNSEIKQINLFAPSTVKATKTLIYDSWKSANQVYAGVEFVNSEKDGLGMPLPGGKVRVYKRDVDGSIEFIGEDNIKHTPKNEKVRLTLGTSFDIAAERNETDVKQLTKNVREVTVELKFRNRKAETAKISATEHFYGDWQIVKKSDDFTKKNSTTAEFTVDVPADKEKIITYTVRYNE